MTQNLKDFPQEELNPYEIEAQHPDDFALSLFDLYPGAVLGAISQRCDDTSPVCFDLATSSSVDEEAGRDAPRPFVFELVCHEVGCPCAVPLLDIEERII